MVSQKKVCLLCEWIPLTNEIYEGLFSQLVSDALNNDVTLYWKAKTLPEGFLARDLHVCAGKSETLHHFVNLLVEQKWKNPWRYISVPSSFHLSEGYGDLTALTKSEYYSNNVEGLYADAAFNERLADLLTRNTVVYHKAIHPVTSQVTKEWLRSLGQLPWEFGFGREIRIARITTDSNNKPQIVFVTRFFDSSELKDFLKKVEQRWNVSNWESTTASHFLGASQFVYDPILWQSS